jgi:hypothetical protein
MNSLTPSGSPGGKNGKMGVGKWPSLSLRGGGSRSADAHAGAENTTVLNISGRRKRWCGSERRQCQQGREGYSYLESMVQYGVPFNVVTFPFNVVTIPFKVSVLSRRHLGIVSRWRAGTRSRSDGGSAYVCAWGGREERWLDAIGRSGSRSHVGAACGCFVARSEAQKLENQRLEEEARRKHEELLQQKECERQRVEEGEGNLCL